MGSEVGAWAEVAALSVSIAVVVGAVAYALGRAWKIASPRSRKASAMTAVVSVVTLTAVTDRESVWAAWWAEHSMWAGLVTSLLLFGAGYLAVDLHDQEARAAMNRTRVDLAIRQAARTLVPLSREYRQLISQSSARSSGTTLLRLRELIAILEQAGKELHKWIDAVAGASDARGDAVLWIFSSCLGKVYELQDRLRIVVHTLEQAFHLSFGDVTNVYTEDAVEIHTEPFEPWLLSDTARQFSMDLADILDTFDMLTRLDDDGTVEGELAESLLSQDGIPMTPFKDDQSASWARRGFLTRSFTNDVMRPGL